MNKLDISILETRNQKEAEIAIIDLTLNARIDYIFQKIGELFNIKNISWHYMGEHYYDYYSKIEDNFITSVVGNNININAGQSSFNILLNGVKFDLSRSIPSRWLFEDFEKELVYSKNAYDNETRRIKERKENQKRLKELQKKENKELLQSIKDKLSDEEILFLGLK